MMQNTDDRTPQLQLVESDSAADESEDTGFLRGKRAWMVFRTSPKNAPQLTWDTVMVTIRSAGPKYVTVVREGHKTQFSTTDKPVLLSTKNRSYLVRKSEQADRLLAMLRGSAAIAK